MLTNVATGIPVTASVSLVFSGAGGSLFVPAPVEAPIGALSWARLLAG